MKYLFFYIGVLVSIVSNAQPKIHAHNDYEKPEPLVNALHNKVFSIEADIWLVNDRFYVAHTMKQIDSQKTLQSLYLNPIIKLFDQNNGKISKDDDYVVSLVIDVKNRGTEALKKLSFELQSFSKYFDRNVNPKAVQIIISGDRGPIDSWRHYPAFIYFDGRPYEKYDSLALAKVAMVSDLFTKYLSSASPTLEKIKSVAKEVHQWKKPFRLWAAPDNERSWALLRYSGMDIINTDKVAECTKWIQNN